MRRAGSRGFRRPRTLAKALERQNRRAVNPIRLFATSEHKQISSFACPTANRASKTKTPAVVIRLRPGSGNVLGAPSYAISVYLYPNGYGTAFRRSGQPTRSNLIRPDATAAFGLADGPPRGGVLSARTHPDYGRCAGRGPAGTRTPYECGHIAANGEWPAGLLPGEQWVTDLLRTPWSAA